MRTLRLHSSLEGSSDLLSLFRTDGMARHPALTEAVRRALLSVPMSRRKIADAADVPHTTLNGIVNREYGASLDVAEAVARVLEDWAGELADEAKAIRAEMDRPGEGD